MKLRLVARTTAGRYRVTNLGKQFIALCEEDSLDLVFENNPKLKEEKMKLVFLEDYPL